MSSTSIPDKLYFKIGEVSEIVGLKPYVLRYWETEFREISPVKSRTNQRLYKKRDVETILKIRDLLHKERFTINGARKKLKEENGGKKEASFQLGLGLSAGDDNASAKSIMGIKAELDSLIKDMIDSVRE